MIEISTSGQTTAGCRGIVLVTAGADQVNLRCLHNRAFGLNLQANQGRDSSNNPQFSLEARLYCVGRVPGKFAIPSAFKNLHED